MYVTSGGRVLRRGDKLRSCGVYDGSTVQVVSRIRGGGRHKDKKSRQRRIETGTRVDEADNSRRSKLFSETRARR